MLAFQAVHNEPHERTPHTAILARAIIGGLDLVMKVAVLLLGREYVELGEVQNVIGHLGHIVSLDAVQKSLCAKLSTQLR